ncbi:MAG: hypothetical protein HY231_14605 [Acidobacteria bacterium]|nr:hypothetical protein [Acidobacteriota bacterium]
MKELIKIIGLIMIVFVLVSLSLYKVQIGRTLAARRGHFEQIAPPEIKTTEGQISLMDMASKMLILTQGNQLVPFSFDERTAVSVSDHFVQAANLSSGVTVKVKYVRQGNRNWAQEILLAPTQ